MSETVAQLRQTLIDVDRQLLAILPPHETQDHAALASLEHARTAAQRLLLTAEIDESEGRV
jgi:hypothetical protein